jgi:predicted MPP superfamily phosphohydrolase
MKLTRWARRALFLLVVATVFGLILVYPPLRIASLVTGENWFSLPWATILFALPFGARLLSQRYPGSVTRALSATVFTLLGACFLAFCLLIPLEPLLLADLVPPAPTGLILVAVVGALSAFGIYNAHRLHIRSVPLKAPIALRNTTLVQISDVHLGSRQPGLLQRIVQRVNQLRPQWVVITGDLVDMEGITESHLAPLAQLQAPALFCIGNHERYIDVDDICARLTRQGVEVLRNRSVTRAGMQFLGIDDAESKQQVEMEIQRLTPVEDHYRILLYHRPDGAEAAAAWGVDLMLTGHTHRGQIMPFHLLVKRFFPRLYRDYSVDGMTLYVSPGTGTWGPVLRLGSRCEITLFELL